MENGQDKKPKEKQLPEEEVFGELDAMYQRVADIEKEEAEEVSVQEETKDKERKVLEKGSKKKSGQGGKRPYRLIILGAVAVLFALILAITFWKPTALLQFLKIGETQQPTVSQPPRLRKLPAAVTPPAPSASPSGATSQTPPSPPLTTASPMPPTPPPAAASSAPAPTPAQASPVQTKQEALKGPREESEKTKPIGQETVKPDKLTAEEKYYAVQVGSFRHMENVRDLAGVLKKEGLDTYWVAMKDKKGETFYRVFVGQFKDKNGAAQFLKDKKIFRNYPGSFIQEVASSKTIDGSTK